MGLREEILALARAHAGKPRRNGDPEVDFFGAYRPAGDDIEEFLLAFAERFETDLSGLLWYFHYNANEPPSLPQHVFAFSPAGKRLPLHPITLANLVAAAQAGHWSVTYPPHEPREIFWAKLNRWLFVGFILAAATLWAWTRFGP